MPYLTSGRKAQLDADPSIATEPGDFNYLFTKCYLEEWLKPGNQRYATIHKIKAASQCIASDLTFKIESVIETTRGTPTTNIYSHIGIAKRAAYDEFRRRVVEPYEEYCIAKNGDLEGYQKAELLLDSRYGE
jgi:hypothetical protein